MNGYEKSKVPRIFERMEELGLKAKDVTAMTGITAGTLTDWKSGRSMPSSEKLILISEFLGVSPDYIIEKEEFKKQFALHTKELDHSFQELLKDIQGLSDRERDEVSNYIKYIKYKNKEIV